MSKKEAIFFKNTKTKIIPIPVKDRQTKTERMTHTRTKITPIPVSKKEAMSINILFKD